MTDFLAGVKNAKNGEKGITADSERSFTRLLDRLICSAIQPFKGSKTNLAAGPRGEENVAEILAALPGQPVVLHDVAARYGQIDHLVLRQDGAVFLIETQSHCGTITEEKGQLRKDGHPLDHDLIRETTMNAFSLRDVLEGGLGISPRINAAIVFPNALVAVPRAVYGVDVLEAESLENWITKARGNAEIAGLLAGDKKA